MLLYLTLIVCILTDCNMLDYPLNQRDWSGNQTLPSRHQCFWVNRSVRYKEPVHVPIKIHHITLLIIAFCILTDFHMSELAQSIPKHPILVSSCSPHWRWEGLQESQVSQPGRCGQSVFSCLFSLYLLPSFVFNFWSGLDINYFI